MCLLGISLPSGGKPATCYCHDSLQAKCLVKGRTKDSAGSIIETDRIVSFRNHKLGIEFSALDGAEQRAFTMNRRFIRFVFLTCSLAPASIAGTIIDSKKVAEAESIFADANDAASIIATIDSG